MNDLMSEEEFRLSLQAMSIGKRIRALRKRKKLNQSELAELANVSPITVSSWENEKYSPQKKAADLAHALEVPVSAIVEGSFPDQNEQNSFIPNGKEESIFTNDDPDVVKTVLISSEVRLSAGVGNTYENMEWTKRGLFIIRDGKLAAIYGAKKLLTMEVEGDSMEPQIHDGEFVTFVLTQDWVPGNLVVAVLNNHLYVKGIVRGRNKEVILRSMNPAYRDLEVTEGSDFYVCGRVVKITPPSRDPKPIF